MAALEGLYEYPGLPMAPELADIRAPLTVLCENPGSPMWLAAVAVEAEVFKGSNYVEDAAELEDEYKDYNKHSSLLTLAMDGEVVGATRVISYALGTGFKTLNDAAAGKLEITAEGKAALDECDPFRTMEVGTIALKSEFRSAAGDDKVWRLYGAIYKIAHMRRASDILASFDAGYYAGFREIFGPALQQLGPAVMYMGSETIPALLSVDKVDQDFQSPQQAAIVEALRNYGDTLVHEY